MSGSIVQNQCWIKVSVGNALECIRPDGTIDHAKLVDVLALIDTGATASAISKKLATRLNLQGITRKQVMGAHGPEDCDFAPMLIGFRVKDPQGVETILHRIHAMAVMNCAPEAIFGMTEIMPGVLVVDGPKQRWGWGVPPTGVTP